MGYCFTQTCAAKTSQLSHISAEVGSMHLFVFFIESYNSKSNQSKNTQRCYKVLHKLYKWADTNNMKFNANKFELLRYGKEQEIKSATTYKIFI